MHSSKKSSEEETPVAGARKDVKVRSIILITDGALSEIGAYATVVEVYTHGVLAHIPTPFGCHNPTIVRWENLENVGYLPEKLEEGHA